MKDYNIQYRVYKYAPESFRCSVNGKCLDMDSQMASRLGQMVVCGRKKEAEDEIKRIVRKNRNQRRRVTFGFFKANGSRDYMFTRELGAYDDDLQDKLRIYKRWKEYCLSRDCDLATHFVTSGKITPDGATKGEVRESSDIVDITRPVKLRFAYREVVI